MGRRLKIPILPLEAYSVEWQDRLDAAPDSDPFDMNAVWHNSFGPSGRWLLGAALATRNLTRSDEIAIITTSDETYVTTCVTATAFNFAAISRTVTPRTRVVVFIHEFGYVSDDARARIEDWQSRGLFVIEDCAHVVGLDVDGVKVGGFSEMALYSLPKIVPVDGGGLLRSRQPITLPAMNDTQQAATDLGIEAAERYLSKFPFLNARRLENAEAAIASLPADFHRFEPSRRAVPWHLGLVTAQKLRVLKDHPSVEWGHTFRTDLLYLPTNPFVPAQAYRALMAALT